MYTMSVYIEYKLENKDKLNNFSVRIEHFLYFPFDYCYGNPGYSKYPETELLKRHGNTFVQLIKNLYLYLFQW